MKLLLSLVLMVAPSIQPQDAKVRAGHTHDILNVHFNAKATRLVSYSAGDGWMIQWDVNTGRVMWQTKTNAIQKGNEYYTLTSYKPPVNRALPYNCRLLWIVVASFIPLRLPIPRRCRIE